MSEIDALRAEVRRAEDDWRRAARKAREAMDRADELAVDAEECKHLHHSLVEALRAAREAPKPVIKGRIAGEAIEDDDEPRRIAIKAEAI